MIGTTQCYLAVCLCLSNTWRMSFEGFCEAWESIALFCPFLQYIVPLVHGLIAYVRGHKFINNI